MSSLHLAGREMRAVIDMHVHVRGFRAIANQRPDDQLLDTLDAMRAVCMM